MATPRLKHLYDSQYVEGEWKGPWWYQKLRPFIVTREEVVAASVPSGIGTLLDLGCGEGELFSLTHDKLQQFIGLDVLPARLKRAQKNADRVAEKKARFLEHDLDEKLPVKTSSCDVVTCVSVLEYVLDPVALIDEMVRVLKPGGTLILEVPNLAYVLERVRLLSGQLVGVAHAPGWQGGRLHHFTRSSLVKTIESKGLRVTHVRSSGFFASLRSLWPSLLGADIVVVARKGK